MECLVFKTVARPRVTDKYIKDVVFFVLKKLKKKKGSLSVHLIGDHKMKSLNAIYRNKRQTTDVLSFAAQEGFPVRDTEELGDIFISVPQIIRQAREYKITHKEEMTRMLIHGILHLLGYDHIDKVDAKKMFIVQERFIKQFV
ncbi:rRNA maturation RNase YbeY [Candidatus Parcubacteria bacterium]|nr:MAG: rRNA maturation RNase YbeY [Candidatus Parcubacteria bacterium]